ncbi:lipid droplet assembly factor 1 isoform X1 [Acanthochromis polyacanthus]|uniref:lipid droplet assembly factor 1 isoform X1 n=1 Tax=Acanthochromis polyacanthus TaxID=80966 RepID=UPI0022343A10|nr:lipid droplet assembly factor 1 isoform X1 [Acanthochromis polyacanthus]
MKPGSRDSELQQLWGRWMVLLKQLQEDPRVSVMLNSRVGQYLSRRPFSALALVLFVAMAALPVGLFLTFALVTITMSVVGFVFFEGFLLFVAGVTLLCVLSAIAFFSVLVSVISNALFLTASGLLNLYGSDLTKQKIQKKEGEASAEEEEQ